MGALLTTFTDMTIKNVPLDPLYVVVFFAVLVTTLSFMILFRIETVDEFRYEVISSMNEGFVSIESESISGFSISLVKKASFVRTVGTARQDVLEQKSERTARGYLKSFETKLNSHPKDGTQKFNYLRVLPKKANHKMSEHIKQCIKNAEKTGNVFNYKQANEFEFYISFTLFDNTDMLLILDNEKHSGDRDNVLCLWSRDQQTITAFINHFDAAWKQI